MDESFIRDREKVSKPSFDTWLKSTEAKFIENDQIVIAAPNEFARDWLENSYSKLISSTIYDITGAELEPKFIIPETEDIDEPQKQPIKKMNQLKQNDSSSKSMLNSKYTFETFVIGSGNRFAHAASLAVAEAPAKAYNPPIHIWWCRSW